MNNKQNAGRTTRFFGIIWIVTLALLVVSLVWDLGIGQIPQVAMVLVLILSAVIFYTGGFFYVEIEPEPGSFRVKHYNLFPFWQEFKVYQIPLERYHKYEIKKAAGGLFSWLLLFEQTSRGLARYPGIGLSALSAAQLKTITDYLESIRKNP